MKYSELINSARAQLRGTNTDCIAICGHNYSDEAESPNMVSVFPGNNEGYFISVSDRNGDALFYVRTHGSRADALEIHNALFKWIDSQNTPIPLIAE